MPTYDPKAPPLTGDLPLETWFPDITAGNSQATINSFVQANYSDAIEMVCVLGGDPEAWNNILTWFDPGVEQADTTYGASSIAVLNAGVFDNWRYSFDYAGWNGGLIKPSGIPVFNAYVMHGKQIGQHPQQVGEITFPGVFSTCYTGYIEVKYTGRPIWYECYFRTNPNRTDKSKGFSGYTFFGDQSNGPKLYFPSGTPPTPAGAYVNRAVFGVFKAATDITTCALTDIVYGAALIRNGSNYEMSAVVNGVVVGTNVIPMLPGTTNQLDFFWETAWGDLRGLVHNDVMFVKDLGVGSGFSSFAGLPADPLYNNSASPLFLNTYDVKFGVYVDAPCDVLGVKAGASLSLTHPTLYTTPVTTLLPVVPDQPTPPKPLWWIDLAGTVEKAGVTPYTQAPIGFKPTALSLNPILYFDFEDIVDPAVGSGPGAQYTADIVNGTQLFSHITTPYMTENWGLQQIQNLEQGPVGNAFGDVTGWWGGGAMLVDKPFMKMLNTEYSIVVVFRTDFNEAGYYEVESYIRGDYGANGERTNWYVDLYSNNTNTPFYLDISYYYVTQTEFLVHGGWVEIPLELMSIASLGTGYHVFAFTSGSDGNGGVEMRLYVDGAFIIATPVDTSLWTNAIIDAASDGTWAFEVASCSGFLDEQVIFDRCLTPEEVASLVLPTV